MTFVEITSDQTRQRGHTPSLFYLPTYCVCDVSRCNRPALTSSSSPLQFELDDAPAIEVLLSAYPEPVRVYDLPHPPTEDLEDKVQCAMVVALALRYSKTQNRCKVQ